MQERLEDFLNREIHLKKTDKILLAVSGGADSMVMLHLFHALGYAIEVAHVNFSLRGGESDEDEAFVKSECQRMGVEFHSVLFETIRIAAELKKSIQEVARELRYDWFNGIRIERKCSYIATAHNQTDNLETLLINQLRGSGIGGLTGIPIQRDTIIRPLLCFTSAEIRSFASDEKIGFREDSSNATDNYLRNRIRHSVLPVLRDIDADAEARFIQNSKRTKEWVDLLDLLLQRELDQHVDVDENGSITIPIKWIHTFPHFHLVLYQIINSCGFNHHQCQDITGSETGARFYSSSHCLHVNRNDYTVTTSTSQINAVDILDDGIYTFGEYEIESKTIGRDEVIFSDDKDVVFFDATEVCYPLTLRTWQSGDKIQPLGMEGSKLVSDVMIDSKFDGHLKNRIPILCLGDEILWVTRLRQSEKGKITEATSTVKRLAVNLLLLLILSTFAIAGKAQQQLGVKFNAGYSVVTNSFIPNTGGKSVVWQPSTQLGIYGQIRSNSNVSFGAEVLANSVRCKEQVSIDVFDSSGAKVGYVHDVLVKSLLYLSIPIYASVRANRLTVNLGVQPSFALLGNGFSTFSGIVNGISFETNYSDKLVVDGFDFGFRLGFGFDLTEKMSIDGNYFHGVNDITSLSYIPIWRIRQLSLGLKYLVYSKK
mgnify:CR=1 FL=1